MDFILLANPNMSGGSNLLRKMGWNYPSGTLCLKFQLQTVFAPCLKPIMPEDDFAGSLCAYTILIDASA